MSRYSLEEFVSQTAQRDRGEGLFEFESERILELNLNGAVWTKMGSMIAYVGAVKFTREKLLQRGVKHRLAHIATSAISVNRNSL